MIGINKRRGSCGSRLAVNSGEEQGIGKKACVRTRKWNSNISKFLNLKYIKKKKKDV